MPNSFTGCNQRAPNDCIAAFLSVQVDTCLLLPYKIVMMIAYDVMPAGVDSVSEKQSRLNTLSYVYARLGGSSQFVVVIGVLASLFQCTKLRTNAFFYKWDYS